MRMLRGNFICKIGVQILLPLIGLSGSALADDPIPSPSETKSVQYIALGDSIPFGDNSFIPYTPESRPDLQAFYAYPEIVAATLYPNGLANLACPGESSFSLLDKSVPSKCDNFREDLPLKVDYKGAQIDAAVELVKQSPDLKVVSLSIGGNDFFTVQDQCYKEFPSDEAAFQACLQERIAGAIYSLYLNVQTTAQRLREAGFDGKFVVVNAYSLDYRDALRTQIVIGANTILQSLAEVDNLVYVDVFSAFAAKVQAFGGDTCASGLLIPNPTQPLPEGQGPCDVHVTAEGSQIIADEVIKVLQK